MGIERSEVGLCGQRTQSRAGFSRRQDSQRTMDARLPIKAHQEQTANIVSELVLVSPEVEEDPAWLLLTCELLDVTVQLGPMGAVVLPLDNDMQDRLVLVPQSDQT